MELQLTLSTVDKGLWIESIANIQRKLRARRAQRKELFSINISQDVHPKDLQPCHLVLLGCLLELAYKHRFQPKISASSEMIRFLRDDLKLHHYFDSHHAPNVKPATSTHSNLWKISSSYTFMHSHQIQEYLQQRYFKGKDLSPLKIVLDELYSNISDHSKSEDVAYSYVKYDESSEEILIAFCDFGIGIPQSLKNSGISIKREWIRLSLEKGVSARSTEHNRGFGLDTVISNIPEGGNLRIISDDEFFYCSPGKTQRTFFLNYSFGGTLIYFEIPVASFEENDYLCSYQTL